jgi:hypothetical protein
MTFSETSDAVVAVRIRELLKHPAVETRLDGRSTIYGHTLTWRHLAPELKRGHEGAIYGVIVNTSDYGRFCEIVARVIELRKRKPPDSETAPVSQSRAATY